MTETHAHTRRTSLAAAAPIVALSFVVFAPLMFSAQLAAAFDAGLGQAQGEHLALPAAIVFFTAASFIGAPQPLFIGACVLTLGPERGFLYGWIATVLAACVDYFVGRLARGYALTRLNSVMGRRLLRFIGANTIASSFLIRQVPSAPFVVVNMAFGVARAEFWPFFAGLVLGVLPKTALVAFGLDAVLEALKGQLGAGAVIVFALIAIWSLAIFAMRRWWRTKFQVRAAEDAGPARPTPPSQSGPSQVEPRRAAPSRSVAFQ